MPPPPPPTFFQSWEHKEQLTVKFLARFQAKEPCTITSQAKQGAKLQRKSGIFIFKW